MTVRSTNMKNTCSSNDTIKSKCNMVSGNRIPEQKKDTGEKLAKSCS